MGHSGTRYTLKYIGRIQILSYLQFAKLNKIQERYRSLAPMYYRGAAAAVVVYDITKKVSIIQIGELVQLFSKIGSCKI